MNGFACKILKGDRITIPKQMMLEFNLKVGDFFIFSKDDKKLIFVPVKVIES